MDEGGEERTTLQPGTVVGGGYRVVRSIADGGMGAVFEVEQLTTGARRALKVMHVKLASDPKLRARFVQEARVGVAIQSDHVADVIDAGVDDSTGLPFLVLELLDGVTLSREIRRRGPFEWVLAREVFRQLGHAVSAAHAKGIVHRDLKPSNVFLARSRTVGMPFVLKVLDFGIAELVASVQQSAGIIGTPTWMAPEQANPHAPIGPAADVWAMGLIAFSLFTGRAYWPIANLDAAPTDAMLRRLSSEEIVPASVRAASYAIAELPAGFDEWFAKCVDRDPARRFRDGAIASAEFSQMIDAVVGKEQRLKIPTIAPIAPEEAPASTLAGEEPTRAPTRTRTAMRMMRLRRGLAVALALAGVAGALLLWRERGPEQARSPAASLVPPGPAPSARPLVRLHGSNTIGAELAPALAEAFLAKETGAAAPVRKHVAEDEIRVEARGSDGEVSAIEIQAHGSATAFGDLANDACDIGMASRRIHPDELERLAAKGAMASAASEHVIGLDGIAVIVNPANPLDRLTKAQLASIFDGETPRWSDVGGAAAPIAVHARDDRSGTYDTFKALVLGPHALTVSAKRYESSDALADMVAGDVSAIGFVGLSSIRSAKAVMIQDGASQPLLPSPTTVATEDYPLSRRLYLYEPSGAPAAARRFVDFALSDEGQAIVAHVGFVDLRPACDPNAAGCTACSAELKTAVDGACRLSMDFRFDPATKQLDTRALRDLQRLGALLARGDFARRKVLLFGFGGEGGKRTDEEALGLARAETVAAQLRARGLTVGAVRGFATPTVVRDAGDADRTSRVEVWLR
jgi:phosphate transport system substrate-binding protein